MSPFPLQSLIFPFFFLISSIGLISFYFTKNWIVSISIALLKSILFFCYFGFFFDGTFTLKDDWTYLQDGVEGVVEYLPGLLCRTGHELHLRGDPEIGALWALVLWEKYRSGGALAPQVDPNNQPTALRVRDA